MKKILSSGTELDMTMAPFQQSYALFQAILKELKEVPLNLGVGENTESLSSIFELTVTDALLNTLKNLIFTIIASKEVNQSLLPCLSRCTYDGAKVTGDDFFENERRRNDYLEVVKEVVTYNISPFIGGLGSLFSLLQSTQNNIDTLKSK